MSVGFRAAGAAKLATLAAFAILGLGAFSAAAASDLSTPGDGMPVSGSPESTTASAVGKANGFAMVEPAPAVLPLGTAFSGVELPFDAPVLEQRRGRLGPKEGGPSRAPVFNAERARLFLRSMTVPGWGQATAGRRRAAGIFALVETGVWASFTAFQVQGTLRRQSYQRTARYLAGIDLEGRDEEFRRIVGAFISSDEYNLFVVTRDAANLYYDNPTLYRQYIAEHSLRGSDTWSWESEDAFLRYRSQRKNAHQAEIRANTVLAVAIVNRLVSALHAAAASGRPRPEGKGQSWNLEVMPSSTTDATAFRLGVRTRF